MVFEVPIFGGAELLINISSDPPGELKRYTAVFGDLSTSNCRAFAVHRDGKCGLFFHRDKMGLNEITHESFHAANKIMEWIGASLSEGSCEPYAYLIGWVAERVHLMAIKAGVKTLLPECGRNKNAH